MSRVFIVHRWGGLATDNWYQWLKMELEKEKIEVYIPQMPDTDTPHIATWVPAVTSSVGVVDENTYFVAHSVGNSALLRYIESLPPETKIGGAVFVASWIKRLAFFDEDSDTQKIEHEWLDTPIDLEKVRYHLSKSVAIFSDNDKYVPLDNQEPFVEKLGSKIIIEHNLGHMSPEDGVEKVESIRSELKKLMA